MKSMLREYVRQLLSEAAKGPEDLPDGVFVRIDLTDAGTYEIYYADEEGYYTPLLVVGTLVVLTFVAQGAVVAVAAARDPNLWDDIMWEVDLWRKRR